MYPLLFLYDLTVSEKPADERELPTGWGEQRFHNQELALLFERRLFPPALAAVLTSIWPGLVRRVLGMVPASC